MTADEPSSAVEAMLAGAAPHDLAYRSVRRLYGITFYLLKTLLPTGLVPLYDFPSDFYLFNWRVILAAIIFLLLSLGFFAARHRWPAGLAGWIVYLLLLAPVSGVAQSGVQLVADRYTYLSCMVWAILLAAVLSRLWRTETDGAVRPVVAGFLVGIPLFVLFGLASLT